MVTLTQDAKAALSQALQQIPHEEGQTLRLVARGGAFHLALDVPHEDDQVLDNEGNAVLVVSPQVNETLGDAVIDVQAHPEGARLVLLQGGEGGKE